MGLARGETDACRPAARGDDLHHLRASENLAAGRSQHLFQRTYHGVGAALAEHHAKALVGHGFQIGEHCAARDVWREVEMHAPGGERRLHMVRLEILVEPGARRGEQEPHHVECASDALLAPPVPCGAGQRLQAHRRTEQPEQVFRFSRECRDQATPRSGVGLGECGDARCRLFEIGADAEPAAVREDAGEAIGNRCELQPMRFQFICIFPVKGRASEEAQIHRAKIMTEARQGEFVRLHRAADRRVALENPGSPAFERHMRGAGQTVVARPDKYGLELAHAPTRNSFMLKDNCRCICFRLVGY